MRRLKTIYVERNTMNRKKKMNDACNKKLKKHNDKLRITNKPKYISKADREKMALEEQQVEA
jgi:hypothetical protein